MSTAEMAGADLSRARAMIDVRHYAEASALLARLLAVEPSCEGWCLMATARLGAGDHTGAIEAADKAIPIDPENGWPHRLASSAFFHLSDFPESLKAALRARRLESGQWQSQVLVGQAAVGTGDLKLAAEASAEALRLAPHEPDVLYVAGRVCRARSDYEQAEAHFRR